MKTLTSTIQRMAVLIALFAATFCASAASVSVTAAYFGNTDPTTTTTPATNIWIYAPPGSTVVQQLTNYVTLDSPNSPEVLSVLGLPAGVTWNLGAGVNTQLVVNATATAALTNTMTIGPTVQPGIYRCIVAAGGNQSANAQNTSAEFQLENGLAFILVVGSSWTGNGGANFSGAGNWDTATIAPAGGYSGWLIFPSTLGFTELNNDLPAGSSFGAIIFSNGASAYTIGGNWLVISNAAPGTIANNLENNGNSGGGNQTAGGSITNLSPADQAFNLPIIFAPGLHYVADATNAPSSVLGDSEVGDLSFNGGDGNLGGITNLTGSVVSFYINGGSSGIIVSNLDTSVGNMLGGWAIMNGSNFATLANVNYNGASYTNDTPYLIPLPPEMLDPIAGGGSLVTVPAPGTNWVWSSATTTIGVANATTVDANAILYVGGSTGGTLNLNNSGANASTLRLGVSGGILNSSCQNGGSQTMTIGNGGNNGFLTAGGPNANSAGIIYINNGPGANSINLNAIVKDNGNGKVTLVMNDEAGQNNPGTGIVIPGANTFSGGFYILQGRAAINTAQDVAATTTASGLSAASRAGSSYGKGPVYVYNGGQAWFGSAALHVMTNSFFFQGVGYSEGGGIGAIRMNNNILSNSTITIMAPSAQIGLANTSFIKSKITGPGSLIVGGGNSVGCGILVLGAGNGDAIQNNYTGDTLIMNNSAEANCTLTFLTNSSFLMPSGPGFGNVVLNGLGGNIQALFNLNNSTQNINGLNSIGNDPARTYVSNTVTYYQSGAQNATGGPHAAKLILGNGNASGAFYGIVGDVNGTGGTNFLTLVKMGTGTQVFTNLLAYHGPTTITNGVLSLQNGATLPFSTPIQVVSPGTLDVSGLNYGPLSLNAAQKLLGNGAINGSVNASGTIMPGNGTNSLTLTSGNPARLPLSGGLTLAGGGSYTWDINSATGAAGSDPGWGLVTALGMTNTATSGSKFTVALNTLTNGYLPGNMANFVTNNTYIWTIIQTVNPVVGFAPADFQLNASAFLNPTNIGLGRHGAFSIRLDNSTNVNIYYSLPPSISAQPVNSTNVATTTASFSVTASGGDLSYQWYFNGTALTNGGGKYAGVTTPTLSVGGIGTNSDGGTNLFFVKVMDGAGTNTSNNAMIVGAALTNSTISNFTITPNPTTPDQSTMLSVTVVGDVGVTNPPTGSVVILTNGVTLGSANLTNGVANFSTVFYLGLFTNNAIVATYAGDTNWFSAAANAPYPSSLLVEKFPCVTNASYVFSTPRDLVSGQLQISISDLTNHVGCADVGDYFAFQSSSAGTTLGGSTTADSTYVYYTPPATNRGFMDTFTYTVVGTYGATGTGTVFVQVVNPADLSDIYVDTNYATLAAGTYVNWPSNGVPNGPYQVGSNAFASVQTGVNVVNIGGSVNLAPDTFQEQVVIANSLTLAGFGPSSLIQPTGASQMTAAIYTYPAGMLLPDGVSSNAVGIIIVTNVTGSVVLQNLAVDGTLVTNLPAGAQILDGVLYGETSGQITNVTVNSIATTNHFDPTYGIDVSAVNVASTVGISGSKVTGFDNGGINANGVNLTANVDHNTIVGPGTITNEIPNGISFYGPVVGGEITNNVVHALHYGVANTVGSIGILAYSGATPMSVLNNVVYDTDNGIDPQNTLIQYNDIYSNNVGVLYRNGEANTPTLNNLITNNTVGILIDGALNPNPSGQVPPGTGDYARLNNLAGNGAGVLSYDNTQTFDATSNWWGTVRGPTNNVLNPHGTGVSVSANVPFTPWLGTNLNLTPGAYGYNPLLTPQYGLPTMLVFSTSPTKGIETAALTDIPPHTPYLTNQPVVMAEDALGNQAINLEGAQVTLSLTNNGANPAAVIVGLTQTNTVDGVATYCPSPTGTNVLINLPGIGYVLEASSPGLINGLSTPFNDCDLPSLISVYPQTNCPGQVARFRVTASGFGLTYHWYTNGVALSDGNKYSGVATSTLYISNLVAGDALVYSNYVAGLCGSVVGVAPLTVATLSATAFASPTPVCVGFNATYTVVPSAPGQPTLTYQWMTNGVNLTNSTHYVGVTTSSLLVNSFGSDDATNYSVQVSGFCASTVVNFNTVLLTNVGVSFTSPNPAAAVCPGTNGTVVFTARTSGTGPYLVTWYTNSSATNASAFNLNANPGAPPQTNSAKYAFTYLTNGDRTVTANLFVSNVVSSGAGGIIVSATPVGGGCGLTAYATNSLTVLTNVAITIIAQTNCPSSTAVFAANVVGSGNLTYAWYTNVTKPKLTDGNHYFGTTTATLYVSNVTATVDDVTYSLGVLGATCSAATNSAKLTITNRVNNYFASTNFMACPGAPFALTTLVQGSGPYTYAWYVTTNIYATNLITDGGQFSGSGTATLNFAGVDPTNSGVYSAVVSNPCGGASTNSTTLTVVTNMTVAMNSSTNCSGTLAVFTVTAIGTPPFNFGWSNATTTNFGLASDGLKYFITNASSSSSRLYVSNVVNADVGQVWVSVTNFCGLVNNTFGYLALNVNTGNKLSSQTNCPLTTIAFPAVTTGTGPFTYAWYSNITAGSAALVNSAKYAGVSNSTLYVSNIVESDEMKYSVVVNGACGAPVTNTVSLVIATISCPADIVTNADAGQCYASQLPIGAPATTGCGLTTFTNNEFGSFTGTPVGSTAVRYPVGTNTITWSGILPDGEIKSCAQSIIVTMGCPPGVTLIASPGCFYLNPPIGNPINACGIPVGELPTNNLASGFPTGLPIGTNTVWWTNIFNGTWTNVCAQQVVVQQGVQMTMTCPPDITTYLPNSTCSATFSSAASLGSASIVINDLCGTPGTPTATPTGSFAAGANVVVWAVKDNNGGTNYCLQNVSVVQTNLPTITCVTTNIIIPAALGACYATNTSAVKTPKTSDPCGIKTTFSDMLSHPPVGSNIVHWFTIDNQNGPNQSTECIETVVVSPIIVCATNLVVGPDYGQCYVSATNVGFGLPLVSSNTLCVSSITNDIYVQWPSGQIPLGSNTVNWSVVDTTGVTNTCVQKFTVGNLACPAVVVVQGNSSGGCVYTNITLAGPYTNCNTISVTNNLATLYPTGLPAGSNSVKWTTIDYIDSGNYYPDFVTNTCSQWVLVANTNLPGILAPADISTNANTGLCYATNFNLGLPALSCVLLSNLTNNAKLVYGQTDVIGATYSNQVQFPVGTNPVVWTVTDYNGNTATATQNVVVVYKQEPAIVCPSDLTVNANPNQCVASGFSLGGPSGISDACTNATFTYTNSAATDYGSGFPVGANTVKWTVVDSFNNTNTCNQTVTVTKLQCPNDENGVCDTGKPYCSTLGPGVPQNVGCPQQLTNNAWTYAASLPINSHTVYRFPFGNNTVVWTNYDQSGATNTCNANVIICDLNIPIIVSCATNLVFTAAVGQYGVSTNLNTFVPVATDVVGISTNGGITSDMDASTYPRGVFSIGTNKVVWTVVNTAGNTTSCDGSTDPATVTCVQTVVVQTSPLLTWAMISAPGNLTVTAAPGTCLTFIPSTTLGYPTVSTIGTNGVTAAQIVGVTNTILTDAGDFPNGGGFPGPQVNQATNIIFSGTNYCQYTTNYNVTIVNHQPVTNITITTTIVHTGTNFVVWTATDADGNIGTSLQTVVVVDSQPPTCLFQQPVIYVPADPSACFAYTTNVFLAAPLVFDNCGNSLSLGLTNNLFSQFPTQVPIGSSTIAWTVVDPSGNTTNCYQTLHVGQAPTLYCTNVAVVYTDPGQCYASNPSLTPPPYSTNCGQPFGSIANNVAALYGGQLALGTNVVTWTVTDSLGIQGSCQQNVAVLDSEPPTITLCPSNITVNASPGDCYAHNPSIGALQASDNCGLANTYNDAPTDFPIGNTTVHWYAVDNSSNINSSCVQTVTVVDTQYPSIICPPGLLVSVDHGACYATVQTNALGSASASDACGYPQANLTNNFTSLWPDNHVPPGTNIVTWFVTDLAGHTATCQQQIVVVVQLSVTLVGNQVILSWPSACGTLQETPLIEPTSWSDSTNVPMVVGGTNYILLNATGVSKFYRLKE